MATKIKNIDISNIPDCKNLKIGIATAEWNSEITVSLKESAIKTLLENGVKTKNIICVDVPGSFELTFAAKYLIDNNKLDAVIVIGCVIKGDTPHFDYVCKSVTEGVTALNFTYPIPTIFCLLTTNNLKQAQDRAGGKLGNKGQEAAITALKMSKLVKK